MSASAARPWCAAVPLCFLALACTGGAGAPPNLVLITVDTLRADHLSPYGAEIATPAIQRLADEGIVFENAFCDVTWTIPSMASVFTGRYASRHGVRTEHDRLSGRALTLAEALREHGYTTAAVVGSAAVSADFGFDQGFESYDDEMLRPVYPELARAAEAMPPESGLARLLARRMGTRGYRPDRLVAARAQAWLAASPAEPFFLWVHFFGPHEKLADVGPEPAARRAVLADRRLYARDVRRTDRAIAPLLEALRAPPLGRRSAVVLHSDHGQTLDEHGIPGHGYDLYDTTARVPLIVRLPGGRRGGERVEGLARNLDLFATLLELAGAPRPEGGESRDLLAGPGTESGPPAHTYLETYRGTSQTAAVTAEVRGRPRRVGVALRGLRTPRWKLVVRELAAAAGGGGGDPPLPPELVAANLRRELYDLAADPGEQHDLAGARPEVLRDLLARLDGERGSGRGLAERVGRHDPETLERLRAIGYVD